MSPVVVHWFRHGQRLHDNPALLDALEKGGTFYPIFIFDGEVAGTEVCGYVRWRFLLESLKDLDDQFAQHGGRLFVFRGPVDEVLTKLIQEWGMTHLTFEQDPEPIWQKRDQTAKAVCERMGVQWVERVSHTLWDPNAIIEENGGTPPLTYEAFCAISSLLGDPLRPMGMPDFTKIQFNVPVDFSRFQLPTLESLGIEPDVPEQLNPVNRWLGGETPGLALCEDRVRLERDAFSRGKMLPNQMEPNMLSPPTSLSPYLRFGNVSVRKFYWEIKDAYAEVSTSDLGPRDIVSQLIWREYFYTMSVNNPYFDQMKKNAICLNIDWYEDETKLDLWTKGMTGFPWIDAIMRQILQEGWAHHVGRSVVAGFLTRGDLWITWEAGAKVFFKYQIDADWSVCAGNWMWVSSSAFEKILDCPACLCPIRSGRAMDPQGHYVRRYVPELANMPLRFLFQPWRAPKDVQKKAGCIIGEDYPEPVVNHQVVMKENMAKMGEIRRRLGSAAIRIAHCGPSNEKEAKNFIWMSSLENNEIFAH